MGLHLGFYYHLPVLKRADQLYVPGFLGRFIEALATRCERVVCFQHEPRRDDLKLLDFRLTSSNVTWVNIGPRASVPYRTIFARRYASKLREYAPELDAVLLRGPSPLLPAMAGACGSTPVCLYLVGDYAPRVDHLPQPRWRKELIRAWVTWYNLAQRRAAKESLTFVINSQLRDEMDAVGACTRLVTAASIDAYDFFERSDTCHVAPYRLLYVGRIAPYKGVFELVEAVQLLTKRGEDVVLDLVGWTEERDATLQRLSSYAASLGVGERVIFHGLKPFGSELFRYYQEGDIFVLAPRDNEGGPRAIWEALAFSLPVVCTQVGGIPDLLEDGQTARLVPPRDSGAFAIAIQEVLKDSALRRRMITNGRSLVRNHTIASLVDEMVVDIEEWCRDRRATAGTLPIQASNYPG